MPHYPLNSAFPGHPCGMNLQLYVARPRLAVSEVLTFDLWPELAFRRVGSCIVGRVWSCLGDRGSHYTRFWSTRSAPGGSHRYSRGASFLEVAPVQRTPVNRKKRSVCRQMVDSLKCIFAQYFLSAASKNVSVRKYYNKIRCFERLMNHACLLISSFVNFVVTAFCSK